MEGELKYLLYDLCVEWGFCTPADKSDEICKRTEIAAKEFAFLVLEAEGMNPEYEKQWVNKIAQKFRERFGQEEILHSEFKGKIQR